MLDWWLGQNPHGRHIYAGNYLSRLNGTDWPVSEFLRQVDISRRANARKSLGNIFFSVKVFMENRFGVNESFRSQLYPRPALIPPMPWLDAQAPEAPQGVETSGHHIQWQPQYSEDVRSLALYKRENRRWQLEQILSRQQTEVEVEPGRYALRTVDALSNQSEAVQVSVRR